MLDRRAFQSYAFAAVAAGGAIPIMFLPRLIFPHPATADGAYLAGTLATTAVALAWAMWFSIASFRRAEEFVQERTRFAWYWGSMTGVAVMALAYGFIATGGAPGLLDGIKPVRAFGLGLAAMVFAQVAGNTVMSAWWRVTKR